MEGACVATRDNANKQHSDASLEAREKEQVKQTNKQMTEEEYDKPQISRRAERNKDQSR